MRKVEASSGYASQNSLNIHFGLGNADSIQELEILWPSGLIETFTGLQINNTHTLIEGTGIMHTAEPENKSTVKIYPNPAKDLLYIDLKNYETEKDYKILILNAEGKKLISHDLNSEKKINISMLSAGIYFYQLQQNGHIHSTGKFIKN